MLCFKRPKVTHSAFSITVFTFDSEKATEAANIMTAREAIVKKRKQRKKAKNQSQSCLHICKDCIVTDSNQNTKSSCQVCEVNNYKFKQCYPVKRIEKH